MVALTGILMLAAARFAYQAGDVTYFTFDRGILFESANLWISDHWLTMVVNTALILVTALVWMTIIQLFNPFRSLTTLPASLFLIMALSVPDLTDQLFTGSILAATITVCVALLWSSYADIYRLRHIFLIFVILSTLTMTQYCFAIYIPVFIIGCAQMKIFSGRSLIACALGLVTPWWIVLGSGIVSPTEIHAPEIPEFFNTFDFDGTLNMILVSGVTGLLLVVSWFGNLMNVLTLNANLRAFNGSISMISVFTVLAMLADFTNAAAYLPTLMLMTSYQLSYMFGKSQDKNGFIAVISICLIYIAIYFTRIFI